MLDFKIHHGPRPDSYIRRGQIKAFQAKREREKSSEARKKKEQVIERMAKTGNFGA